MKAELQAAGRRLKNRERIMVGLCALASLAFVVGMAWPSVHVAAVLLATAAASFMAAAISVAWRNQAGDDVARYRFEVERDY